MQIMQLAKDDELGSSFWMTDNLIALMEATGAIALKVEECSDVFLLCQHPESGEFDWHGPTELLPELETETPAESEEEPGSNLLAFRPKPRK